MNKFAQIAGSLSCFFLAVGSAGSAHASEKAEAEKKDELPFCSAVIQFEPYLGDRCITQKKAIFTRVAVRQVLVKNPNFIGKLLNARWKSIKGWRNEQTGQIWFEEVALGVDHFEAQDFCAFNEEQTLPSAQPGEESDLARWVNDGVLELFPSVRGHALWSGTIASNNGEEAYWLDLSKGALEPEPFYRTHKGKTAAVCVSVAASASR
jgi:hypothetical protein